MALSLRTDFPVMQNVVGDQVMIDYQVDGDTSYPTGGYELPLSLAQLQVGRVVRVEVPPTAVNQFYMYDYTNNKLLFTDGAGSQTAGATNVSSRTNIRIRIWGSRR